MGEEKRRREPEITAAVISVIGTILGTLLISILLGFLEGRIGLGTVVGVVIFLLLIAIWVLLAFRWGVRLAGAAAAAMVIVGSVFFLAVTAGRIIPSGLPPATPVAFAPSPTPQPMATQTPTTPPSTPSASSAEEARAFAEPILAAIADRPPDFEDDFSDPGSGWSEWEISEAQGKQGYSGGEYFIQVSPDTCGHAMTNRKPEFSDFVLEVDGRFDAQGEADWQVHFRANPSGKYIASISLQRRIEIREGTTTLAYFDGPPVLSGPQGNNLLIIAKGPSIALAVNGEPLVLVQDERFQRGSIGLVVCNKGPTSPTVYFDNLKVWDISTGKEARAFAEPILAAIADRRPDFEDDFSNPKSGWLSDVRGEGKRGYEDGEYFIIANPHPSWPEECCQCNGGTPDVPEFSDFVLEADLQFISGALSENTGHWDVHFRSSYGANFSPDSFVVLKCTEGGECTILAEHYGAPLKSVEETNHLLIIAQGPQIAFYLNGEPGGLVYDETYSKGSIGFLVCTHTDSPLRVHFDNFKVWDISDLSP